MKIYLQLALSALLPIILSVGFYLLVKKTKFGKLSTDNRDMIIGLAFAAIAVFATENGVSFNGATINCRDASVICAGLIFSPSCGIIAGVIAGIERFVASYWGAGMYSQVACSLSTFLASIICWLMRSHIFGNKRCSANFGLAIAVVTEVFHLLLLILTHMDDPYGALSIIEVAAAPMIIVNSLAVFISMLLIDIISNKINKKEKTMPKISNIVQRNLLIVVLIAYVATTSFTFILQTTSADNDTQSLLSLSVEDTKNDISDRTDKNILALTKNIANYINANPEYDLQQLNQLYGATEINIINTSGIIVESTESNYIGFDMTVGDQSKEFMVLISETRSLVKPLQNISFDPTSDDMVRKYAGVRLNKGGFVQVGYDRQKVHEVISEQVTNLASNRHVGQDGYILITSGDEILSSPKVVFKSLLALGLDLYKKETGIIYHSEVNGVDSYWMYDVAEGYNIISVLSVDDAFASRNMITYVNSFMEVMVFATMFLVMYVLINRLVVKNVDKVNGQLAKITSGDLDSKVEVRVSHEFALLTDNINSTVNKLKDYIDEANKRIDAELQLAKDIQISALPTLFNVFQNRNEFDIYATMDAAKQVGGDFYDFYLLDNNHLAFLVADVSGKSVAGAMFMMRAKTMIKNLAEDGYDIADIFTIANNKLCDGNDAGMFVTAWMGILDTTTGHVEYCNAGHNPPVIYRHESGYEYLKCKPGFVLAGLQDIKYKKYELDLDVSDRIFLYTDGVTEATNIDKQLFSEARLLDTLTKNRQLKGKDMLQAIKKDIDEFVGQQEQFDDITMLMLDYFGENKEDVVEKEFVAKDEQLDNAFEFIEQQLENHEVSMRTQAQIKLAFEEAFVNVCHYGYNDEVGNVKVQIKVENELLTIRLIDQAVEFNPLKAIDPNITLSAEERKIGGLGILLVKKVMDCVRYDYVNGNNILTMIKRI